IIAEGRGAEFNYYHYAMNEYHWLPSQWAELSMYEKALVIAGIDIRVKEEKRQQKEAERRAKSKGRHH
ncbi:hypothetical protein, partial [Nocardia heshunensis]